MSYSQQHCEVIWWTLIFFVK